MMTSLALPDRKLLSVDRNPKVTLPLFMTRASLLLMLFASFFAFLGAIEEIGESASLGLSSLGTCDELRSLTEG